MNVDDTYITHCIKKYPDFYKLILYKIPYADTTERNTGKKKSKNIRLTNDERASLSLEKSIQKTKTTISDLILCNDFELFVTFTFNCHACKPVCKNDPCVCDISSCKRYDFTFVRNAMRYWYNSQIKLYGKFDYLQVMEMHKNGGFHFHALFNGYHGKLRFYKKDKDGRTIYSLQSYRRGFTTAKVIYDKTKVSSYVRKYITKELVTHTNKKRFWSNRGLNRPIKLQDNDLRDFITVHPDSIVWTPDTQPKTQEDGSIKSISTNVLSITTLRFDNSASYAIELGIVRKLARLLPGHTAAVSSQSVASTINRTSSTTGFGRLTDDSTGYRHMGFGA